MKKGLELPINVLVVVAVAVIVLLGVAILFMTGFLASSSTLTEQNSWNQACVQVKTNCGKNWDYISVTPLTISGQMVDNFGDMCGAAGRYDKTLAKYEDGEWSALGSNQPPSDTGAYDTNWNGCNKKACACS